MIAKSLDVYVALKLTCIDSFESYAALARDLKMSVSEAHASIKRSIDGGLVDASSLQANKQALFEYLVHGVKYAFPAKRGEITRGIVTAHGVSPLNQKIEIQENELLPVWPHSHGKSKGYSIDPLHPSAPSAISEDTSFYERLSLVDAIRGGRARERKLAENELQKQFKI
ncbi:MAG: hypothetical protein AAGA18_14940 [Verrucomicrobiota bacterium]